MMNFVIATNFALKFDDIDFDFGLRRCRRQYLSVIEVVKNCFKICFDL